MTEYDSMKPIGDLCKKALVDSLQSRLPTKIKFFKYQSLDERINILREMLKPK